MATVQSLLRELSERETWRPVARYPGYEVSSWGNVRRGARPLRFAIQKGYRRVALSAGGAAKCMGVHRLVAEAFLGAPPFAGAMVVHNDGDRLNNRADNLRWASARENLFDCIRHNTLVHGSKHPGAKLTESDIPVIRARIAGGETPRAIARAFGVAQSTISQIKRRRAWRHAGGAVWGLSAAKTSPA